jgi:hypothetical protein
MSRDVSSETRADATPDRRRWLLLALALVAFLFLLRLPQPFPNYLTKYDYRAYWGASYLLAHGQNPGDPGLLYDLQVEQTGLAEETPQMAWNPPWLLVWLIPLTLLAFDQSAWVWFVLSMTLVFIASAQLWQTYAPRSMARGSFLLFLLIVFTLNPMLTTLLVGQITTIVLIGLSGFLFFAQRRQWFLAGLLLALTASKPHLVYLTLPLLLLLLLHRRSYRALLGFALPNLLGLVAAIALRPTILADYLTTTGGEGLVDYIVPTVPGYLAWAFDLPWLRWAALPLLAVVLLLAWRRRATLGADLPDLVAWSLTLSLVTAPYGWSFDVLLFAIPIAQGCVWLLRGEERRGERALVALLFFAAGILVWQQRIVGMPEHYFAWYPLVLALLYGWCRLRLRPPLVPLDPVPA